MGNRLCIVIPCYNEEKVLPVTAPLFLKKIQELIEEKLVSTDSRILFVDDGSKDSTWKLIEKLANSSIYYSGIKLSRNRGHQNAVLAGLMEAKDKFDLTISIDCDGQDDINAMKEMIQEYHNGCEVVYGVRSSRETDTLFKRTTAELFYKLLKVMGVEIVFNHADYRLLSSRVLEEFSHFEEVNLFLRGMIPLVGFKSTSVYYQRHERLAGESHYPLKKMLALAFDGITSLSIKPIRIITMLGLIVSFFSFLMVVYIFIQVFKGSTIVGWASTCVLISFFSGIQLVCIGVIGEYIGKIYLETKRRPRFIIESKIECKN